MRYLILGTLAALGLMACATAPKPLAGDFSPLTPQQAAAQNANGSHVRWGGEIISVEPKADATCFEILARGLYADARPDRYDASDGRFIACRKGFYDPAVFTPGREITVVGDVSGTEQRPVGDYNYTYPHVNAEVVYLWPAHERYPAGYYDPWWGPYYGSLWPWFGPTVVVVHHHH